MVNSSLEGWHIFQNDNSTKGSIVEDDMLIFDGLSDMESGEGDVRWYNFGKLQKGSICFQDHLGRASFKNIVKKELD